MVGNKQSIDLPVMGLIILSCYAGNIVRISPNLLSFSNPVLLPEIYHRHVEKTPFYSTAVTGDTTPLLLAQSDAEHTNKVKMLSPTDCQPVRREDTILAATTSTRWAISNCRKRRSMNASRRRCTCLTPELPLYAEALTWPTIFGMDNFPLENPCAKAAALRVRWASVPNE